MFYLLCYLYFYVHKYFIYVKTQICYYAESVVLSHALPWFDIKSCCSTLTGS